MCLWPWYFLLATTLQVEREWLAQGKECHGWRELWTHSSLFQAQCLVYCTTSVVTAICPNPLLSRQKIHSWSHSPAAPNPFKEQPAWSRVVEVRNNCFSLDPLDNQYLFLFVISPSCDCLTLEGFPANLGSVRKSTAHVTSVFILVFVSVSHPAARFNRRYI